MKRNIKNTNQFKNFIKDFETSELFLDNLTNLILYNGRVDMFITDKGHIVPTTLLLNNCVNTLSSIKLCCSIGSFADANTLIRKLRDDLLLSVYIMDVVKSRKPFLNDDLEKIDFSDQDKFTEGFLNLKINQDLTDDEKAVEAWLTNKVLELPYKIKMKLSFENYMKRLENNSNVIHILENYKLQDYWKTLTNKLNNYVHNNGQYFTSHNIVSEHNKDLDILLKNINIRISYIVTLFLVLTIMFDATLISSSDMMDYLNCDMEPPEDCQYEIAPFIQVYIDLKVIKIHPQLKQFLIDNNGYGMKIK
jgi:hypothetical protein